MNSYVGMTMVKKEQEQDYYFNQQSILLTLPTYISATDKAKFTIRRVATRFTSRRIK